MTPNPNENQAEKHSAEQEFPISGGPSIPWRLITPHEKQALLNHDQTLTRLAERGGLSCCEAVAILEDRRWKPMDKGASRTRLFEIRESDTETKVIKLRAELSTLRKELEEIKARTAIQAIERLVKTCCSQCGHDTTEDGCANCLKLELEAAKKAQEWLMENGKYILERSGFLNERHENELRELLNNGKDGE